MPHKFGFSPDSPSDAGAMRSENAAAELAYDPKLRELAQDPRMVQLRGTLLALVHRDGRDLTARQLTAFLSVYMDDETHSVSSLAEMLRIARPGVTRLMDRLVQFDLLTREEDREDRRRVLVRRTARGAAFFQEIVGISRNVSADDGIAAA